MAPRGSVACTACLAPFEARPKEIFQEPLFGKDFPLFECPQCSVTFSIMPANFPLQDWYRRADHLYSEVEWMMPAAAPLWRFKYFFESALRLKITGDLLDVGCGEGRFLAYARKKGWNGTLAGLDFNPEIARRSEDGLKIEVGPLDQFVKNSGLKKFDVVVLFDVLEHMAEPAKAVAQIASLLKEKAYLCVTVPNAERIRFFGWEAFDYPPHHFTRWNAKALRLIVERAGFDVLAVRTPWCRPADFSDQIFYPMLAWTMPWIKRLLFGSAAIQKTLTELLSDASPADQARRCGLTSRIADKTARKKAEIGLKTLFSILTAPIGLPLCLALRCRRFSGAGLFLLARR